MDEEAGESFSLDEVVEIVKENCGAGGVSVEEEEGSVGSELLELESLAFSFSSGIFSSFLAKRGEN